VIDCAIASSFALGGLVLAASLCAGAEPNRLVLPLPQDMVGTQSCTAASCHGGGGPRYWSGSPKGAEYVHWLGSGGAFSDGRRPYDPRARLIKTDGDPHALAAQRMQEPRFQEVLRRAGGGANGSVDPAMHGRCAKCHDPGFKAPNADGPEEIPAPVEPNVVGPTLGFSERFHAAAVSGIGCETCHGGARKWLTLHYQSGVTRDELLHLGMVDTKDLQLRARLCASCHVGSTDQDMNHDMIAAGHPPLRFEQASYEALLGRKHWDDTPARLADPNYEVQLWAAGRVAAAAAALELLEARSQGTGHRWGQGAGGDREQEAGDRRDKPWPEFAESNCLACHQPLRRNLAETAPQFTAEKQLRGPAWQTWNTSFVEAALVPRSTAATELPLLGGPWSNAIQKLRSTLEQSAEPDRQEVARMASQAKTAFVGQAANDVSALTASSVLEKIGELDRGATWDELCQYLAALAAVRRALADQGKLSPIATDPIQQRIDRVAAGLRFVAPNREWPVLYSGDSSLSSAEVLRELAQIRQDLLSEARR
jgi:hypothetical protein